ncbi:adaptin-N domain-containing protein [Favolaschia claudopus]|uniref:Adaptin-N domain-containing protein n=1 Tax=Favolaschia claudopus TaxID=2862362 RepID=A0AAW0DZN5_9AGAR
MDVPFVDSGALSRAHYGLVKNVESSQTSEMADSYILKEVESIRHRLRHPKASIKETKECLIVLLYCSTSITSSLVLPAGSLDFALPHAINLAEAATKVYDKRIGYLFCAEIMSPTHELRLMLVNTLRKDLESSTTAVICLALDNLITSPSEDVVPAVQSRLHDLLSNSSPHVRRRALLACAALSPYEPSVLREIAPKVLKRIRDHHFEVATAALTVALELFKAHEPAQNDIREAVNSLLQSSWSKRPEHATRPLLLQILRVLRHIGLLPVNIGLVLQIIQSTAATSDHPVMYAAFLLLHESKSLETANGQPSQPVSPAAHIRELLTSQSVNDQYIFLSCLACLNPETWAGINADIPAVLEQWEVGRVMELLDSSDSVIRSKTLRILSSIDPNIVSSYYSQSLQTLPADLNLKGISEYTTRLLEVIALQIDEDGELYARQLTELFGQMEARSPRYAQMVIESAVEMVLSHLRNASISFQIGCATTLVASLADREVFLGQTMVVITSALASEYAGRLAVPPPEVLGGLASRLSISSLPVQDACLLTMLRLSAECEQVPPDVVASIGDLAKRSRRHIRQRCDDFISLSPQRDLLQGIVHRAESPSLPDFLAALQEHKVQASSKATSPESPPPRELSSPSSSPASLSASKLKYTAYDAPPPASRLRDRGLSRGSSRPDSRASSQLSGDELSRTVTAGDLTLAAAAQEFEMAKLSPRGPGPVDNLVGSPQAADLITLNDSPFISDPSVEPTVDAVSDAESIWNGLDDSSGARGWCDSSLEDFIKRLESMDGALRVISAEESPFEGDVKIIIHANDAAGVLRVRASEDGGCLWRMRSGDDQLRKRVKELF